ncbi:putative glycosyltransferase [Trabulsiella guamensis ATCC 49490]|uniref:Putative glycosyltransferase n=2 Tax=Trabulsiella guamensis TaxID=158852 RepID=A0A084ZQR0_9ENTR|nr:putative glycosyltransferase [Trabulsiella guamensis ATCC 49490]
MGTLTKQFYRYSHKRNMRHNENLWPFVKIQRNSEGEITTFTYKKEPINIVRLSSLAQKYTGEVLLTATGPSVNTLDFSRLPEHINRAGVNGAWHLNGILRFNLYFVVDMTFIDHHTSVMEGLCKNSSIILFTTVMGIVKLIEQFGISNIVCQIAILEDICYQTYQPSVKKENIYKIFHNNIDIAFSTEKNHIAYAKDIRQGVFDAGTVVYWALQALGYLGFKKIYIAGLDMNNFNDPRFYEDNINKRPSFLQNKVKDTVIPALQLASTVLAEMSVSVINLSSQSAVPESIFPKQDFNNVFS